ncbi:WLM domain-containing protein [Syncephalis fuscata]|nr:WLM domain-containing protein [Syncephalis fuscata]
MTIAKNDTPLIFQCMVLKRQPLYSEATALLQQLAQQVQPIMAKYNWHVGLLREFLPKNENLLGINVNKGQEIRIRLRYASNPHQFIDYESLLGTLLHELTHIVHGPHDSNFYKLLDKLTDECEQLLMKNGYTAASSTSSNTNTTFVKFAGHGSRLGKNQSQSAVDRWKLHCSPAQMAAMAAIQRRGLLDATWCGGDATEEQMALEEGDEEITIAKALSKSIATMSSTSDATAHEAAAMAAVLRHTKRKSPPQSTSPILLENSTIDDVIIKEEVTPWSCTVCTLINKPLALMCSACHQLKNATTLDHTVSSSSLLPSSKRLKKTKTTN